MLEVQQDVLAGAPLLILQGRFDGTGAVAFDEVAGPMGEGPSGPLLLDMEQVDYLSSAGLRSLMLLAKARWRHQSRLWMIAMQSPVLQVVEMAGLTSQFEVFTNRAEVETRLHARTESHTRDTVVTPCGREHTLLPIPGAESTLDRWPVAPDHRLTCLALEELGVAVGRAGLGNTAAQAAEALGAFISTGHMISVRPMETGGGAPDFVVTNHPATVPVYVEEAWRLNGRPAAFVTANDADTTVADVIASFPALLQEATGEAPGIVTWIIAALDPESDAHEGWVGIGGQPPDGDWQMEAVRAQPLALNAAHEDAPAFLRATLHVETLTGAFRPKPEQRVGRYVAWLYAPSEIRTAADHRLQLVFEDVTEPHEEWDWIARRIYAGAGSLRLRQLCGGYSAVTFHAESRDQEGRRMLPTVLKISDPAFSERENKAYDLYVSKYILNNSAVRMGHCSRNNWVGLRYNFLGITGPESQLSWIGEHFVKRPVDESMPLFRELFEKILHPWYGQARPAAIKPYREHDPRILFRGLADVAKEVLNISPDAPFIPCPPLGRDLPNPYFFLEHLYTARADAEWPGMSSIVHGDLNMNNVLLDEKENMYVIDFSETHIGELGGDFSRLEPLVLLQMTRMENETDLTALLRYMHAVARPETLFDPPYTYDGDDPFMPKAHALVKLLRQEIRTLSGDREHPVCYLLGLLHWSLPIVFFHQMPLLSKQASCYASALLIEALLEADPETAQFFHREG
ncbi:MAG: hypothetical protein EOM20_14225 [Spartobacteria bacterium]|nr:hypothetical protein [Spartobacteria bacterium]